MLSSFQFIAIGFNVETVTYKNLKFQGEENIMMVCCILLLRKVLCPTDLLPDSTAIVNKLRTI